MTTKPISSVNVFAGALTSIPLSDLDSNFSAILDTINDANSYSNYGIDTGYTNDYRVSLVGITTSYSGGLRIQFKAANTNTGASTLSVNGQPATPLVFDNGADLTPGVIVQGMVIEAIYDGVQFQIQKSSKFSNLVNGLAINNNGNVITRTLSAFGNGITISNATGISGNPTVVSNATSSNISNSIVFRDALGKFIATEITSNLVGNVTGNVSGTALNITGIAAVANGGTGASNATDARTNLGLGSMAVQSSSAVTITGGNIAATFTGGLTGNVTGNVSGTALNITGIAAVSNGGTGATNAASARANLGVPAVDGTSAYGTWGINVSGTATYLSAAQQVNLIYGASRSLNMSGDSANLGSFLCRAGGSGDANLAGMTFWQDNYAIKLGVRADGYFGLGGWSRGAWSWYSDPSGNMVASGNITAYSDPNLKEKFAKIKKPFDILDGIDGGTFVWKSGKKHTENKAGQKDYGVLADQVEAVMPEIVSKSIDIDGEQYRTVSYEKLIPVLIEAVKTLRDEIKTLKKSKV